MNARPIDDVTFIVFDVETTGLYPEMGDRVCEIGAMKLIGERVIDEFWTMVDPGRPISPGAFRINRITPEMLEGAPGMAQIMPRFLRFVGDGVLVAYNAKFDLGFLNSELSILGYEPFRGNVIDVMMLAKRLMPYAGGFSLQNVAGLLGIRSGRGHRALEDVRVTVELFLRFMGILRGRGLKSLEELLSFQTYDPSEEKVELIRAAIRDGKNLRIRYVSYGIESERVVTPIEIQRRYDRFYLIGFCHLRNDERNFRVDRIVEIKVIQ